MSSLLKRGVFAQASEALQFSTLSALQGFQELAPKPFRDMRASLSLSGLLGGTLMLWPRIALRCPYIPLPLLLQVPVRRK